MMADKKTVKVQVDLGIRRLLLVPVLVGLLFLAVLVYGYMSIVGNERLSLVAQGLAIAHEIDTATGFEGWNQYTTGDWVSQFIEIAQSQGKGSEDAGDNNAVLQYAGAVDWLIAGKIREGVRERVAMEVQVNYLRTPKDVDPYKLLEAAWEGMLLQHTVLPAVTPTPTPTPTATPVICTGNYKGYTYEAPEGESGWETGEGELFTVACFSGERGRIILPTPTPSLPTTEATPPPNFSPTPAFRSERSESFWLWEPGWWPSQLPDGSLAVIVAIAVLSTVALSIIAIAFFKGWVQ